MVEPSRRAPVRGPTFIRLIARLADLDIAQPEASLSDRLGQWIDWTRAVALSRALDHVPAAGDITTDLDVVHEDPIAGADADDGKDGECARARVSLAAGIAEAAMTFGETTPADAADLRKRYVSQQRAMQTATGRLRGRLRDRLATGPAAMARLAEVDAVMELVLSPKEHALLASVPDLVGARFEHLQAAACGNEPHAGESAPHAADTWLALFRRDMQDVLLAELDVRFQPIEGLLAALRPQRHSTS